MEGSSFTESILFYQLESKFGFIDCARILPLLPPAKVQTKSFRKNLTQKSDKTAKTK